ncbi:MAG: hypothetical protein GY724_11200 [Actinomycetia bacterium]|nr:hypothetical protein [Actinomycetes bacterium]MCP4222375.1 hypothetical protein [Actinomycetes bacterium]MCP5030239.1 hypothetical protein [Actinomycetes bacterium]
MASTTDFDPVTFLASARTKASKGLGRPGDWLSAAQRVDAWTQARDASTNELDQARREAISPFAVAGEHPATPHLSATAVDLVHRLATDSGRLSPSWAETAIAELGEETYTELVGVVAIATIVDTFDRVIGDGLRTLPEPEPGDPNRVRPEGVGDVGAWVSQSLEKGAANVSRTLTLVPETNSVWRPLVDSHYSRGAQFLDLQWDRHLSRPQVELTAARTTALNECFY